MSVAEESLVVHLQAESSGLTSELNRVATLLDQLQSRSSGLGRGFDSASRSLSQFAQSITSLSGVSRGLTQIQQQVTTLGQTPVALNISPALRSLQQLSQTIAAVAAQLGYLSGMASVPFAGGIPAAPAPVSGASVRRYAEGGLVTGPGGLDRVPAWLTAGEFVLRRESVDQLGLSFLQAVNQRTGGITDSRPAHGVRSAHLPAAPDTGGMLPVGPWGDIRIEVRDSTRLATVLQELSRAETRLRTRRG